MRLSKMVTLLLAGFLTFGSLNSVAATKHAKAPIVKKLDASKKKKAQAVKSSKTFAKKVKKKTSVKNKHKQMASQHFQSGTASYYADEFNGRRTSNGERFSNTAMTASHKTLPTRK